MLEELHIHNFAIIDQLDLSFKEGMTVLTGETGAGKSIIIDAVSLLLGGRGSSEWVRTGETKCRLEALFNIEDNESLLHLLSDLGIEADELLVIQRELYQSGRNVCRLNGQLVNTTMLKKVGAYLVDIQGQYDQQKLMHEDSHLDLLDQYGHKELALLKEQYTHLYERYQTLKNKLQLDETKAQDYAQRMDMLQFQVQEIEAAQLVVGEEEQLKQERELLCHASQIYDSLNESATLLNGEDFGALALVAQVKQNLTKIADLAPEYKKMSENITSAYYLLQEVDNDLYQAKDQLDLNPQRLDEVELRLQQIRSLERKYGANIEEVLLYYNKIQQELAEAQFDEQHLEQWREELTHLQPQLEQVADQLHQARLQVAQQLEKALDKELVDLCMPNARFFVRFTKKALQKDGADKVQFYMSTNKGEAEHPLVKILSGGELSRLLLALKAVFNVDQVQTSIVFDEVDTGVSGRVATAIAKKIYQLAKQAQVLCITHLPQVAAIADQHYFIQKEEQKNRVKTTVQVLTEVERDAELARMMTGEALTDLSLEHAKELRQLSRVEQKKLL